MEGTASKLSSRWIAARQAAVLLIIGALSVGLSACGSDSSSDSSNASGSTSAVVEKEAATSQVQLTVVNHASEPVNDAFCRDQAFYSVLDPPSQCNLNGLYPDQTDSFTANPVYGDIQWAQSGTGRVYFEAHNPSIGEPSITLISASPPNDPIEKFTLGQGETKDKTVGSHDYSMHRADDTDVKVMTLTMIK
jgi:hypothetical protein